MAIFSQSYTRLKGKDKVKGLLILLCKDKVKDCTRTAVYYRVFTCMKGKDKV